MDDRASVQDLHRGHDQGLQWRERLIGRSEWRTRAMSQNMWRRYAAELIGTFALLFFGCGTRSMVGETKEYETLRGSQEHAKPVLDELPVTLTRPRSYEHASEA